MYTVCTDNLLSWVAFIRYGQTEKQRKKQNELFSEFEVSFIKKYLVLIENTHFSTDNLI